jgi:hypothetical protein
MTTAPRSVPVSRELGRVVIELTLAVLGITVVLPTLLALAAAGAR